MLSGEIALKNNHYYYYYFLAMLSFGCRKAWTVAFLSSVFQYDLEGGCVRSNKEIGGLSPLSSMLASSINSVDDYFSPHSKWLIRMHFLMHNLCNDNISPQRIVYLKKL